MGFSNSHEFNIAVLPSEGIGIEVTEAALAVLGAAKKKHGGFKLETNQAITRDSPSIHVEVSAEAT